MDIRPVNIQDTRYCHQSQCLEITRMPLDHQFWYGVKGYPYKVDFMQSFASGSERDWAPSPKGRDFKVPGSLGSSGVAFKKESLQDFINNSETTLFLSYKLEEKPSFYLLLKVLKDGTFLVDGNQGASSFNSYKEASDYFFKFMNIFETRVFPKLFKEQER